MSIDLLTCEPMHERQGGTRSYVSPSRLNLWLKCPLAFKIRYVDGVRSPTTPSLFIGKCCHSALEVFYRHRMLGITLEIDDVIHRLEAAWDQMVEGESMKFETVAAEQSIKTQVTDLVRAYLAQVPADEPRPLAVESAMGVPLVDPISGEDLGIPLVGIVDLVLSGAAGPQVIDFKTAARGGKLLEISHEIQLSCYAYAYRQMTGTKECALQIRRLVKTKTPQIETHTYPARTDAHFRRLFNVIREYLDALDSGRFNYRPGFGCSMCDFQKDRCQAWCP